jgi:putative membrane protein insertion efficiency factor
VSARRVLRWVAGLPALVLLGVLRGWQLVVSPTYGQTCRFYPSCSSYAVDAVREYGAARGSWLAVRRLLRCHPWNPGGYDPVPPKNGSAHSAAHDESVPPCGASPDRARS